MPVGRIDHATGARVELLEVEVAGRVCAGCRRLAVALATLGAVLVGPVHSSTVVLVIEVFAKSNTALECTFFRPGQGLFWSGLVEQRISMADTYG